MSEHKSAFSLVELSIVLVILGLLTGGILAGQSLIRAAEIRSVTSEHSRYSAAIHSFREKYLGYPGDLRNAVRFWGTLSSIGPGDIADGRSAYCDSNGTAPDGTKTCNGNGDGIIGASYGEAMSAWKHLANAGLVEGSYTGKPGPTSEWQDARPGVNVPASRMANGGWSIGEPQINSGSYSTTIYSQQGVESTFVRMNGLMFGSKSTDMIEGYTLGEILRPEEAWNVDTKVDDANPTRGKVTSPNNVISPSCVNAAAYRLDNNSKLCSLVFYGI